MKKSLISSLILAILFLSGCGGSSSNNTPQANESDNTKTGIFVDSPVSGLKYKTISQEGYTNDKGEFKYKDDEKVEFFLNTLSLGKVNASEIITPYIIAGNTDISNPSAKASNIALLLQNFDGDRNNTDMIDVTKFKDLGEYDLSYIDLNTTTNAMENEIAGLLATGGFAKYVDESNLNLIDTATVNNTMKNYVKEYTLSFETGFGAKWLDGKILYNVYQNLENGDINNPKWSSNEATTMKFEKGKLHIAEGISNNYLATFDYSITIEGLIKYFDDFNYDNDTNFVAKYRYIHFNSKNDDFIEVCYSANKSDVMECGNLTKNHEVLFFDKNKAKIALENTNFFDYTNTNNQNNGSSNTETSSANIQFDSNYLNGKTFYILYHIKDGLFKGQIIGKHDFTDTQITWTQIYRKNTSWGSDFLESGVDNYTSNNNVLDVTRVKYTNENGEQNPQHSFTMTLKDKIDGYDGKSFIENANGYEFELYIFNNEQEARNYLSYLDNL